MKILKKIVAFPLQISMKVAFGFAFYVYKIVQYFSLGFARRVWLTSSISNLQERFIKIQHADSFKINRDLLFVSPNYICDNRYLSFSIKEPETLEWIDNCPEGVFYDIGANVGLYSVYYGIVKDSKIYAFECAPFNLPVLTKNINYNSLAQKVNLVVNPLGNQNDFKSLHFFGMDEGDAGHVFASDLNEDGLKHNYQHLVNTLGFSLDYMLDTGLITDFPVNVKIDVDGTELNIIRGALRTLSNPICRNILIEVNEKVSYEEIVEQLTGCGFSMQSKVYKKHFSKINEFGNFSYISNQIWSKD